MINDGPTTHAVMLRYSVLLIVCRLSAGYQAIRQKTAHHQPQPSPPPRPHVSVPVIPSSHDKHLEGEAVLMEGEPWSGLLCSNLNEGMRELLVHGFAVFETEEAMFSDAGGRVPDEASVFSGSWLKEAPPVEVTSASALRTAPLAAFGQRLTTILESDRKAFEMVDEEFLSAITVSGAITRGGGGGSNGSGGGSEGQQEEQRQQLQRPREEVPHVYSLHQDPCFFTSLKQRAASSGTGGGQHGVVYPFDAVARIDNEDKLDGGGGGGGDADAAPTTIVRQVNFWLPHTKVGDKHLLLLSREASRVLSAKIEGGADGARHRDGSTSTSTTSPYAVKKANGNRWLTRRGLEFVAETLGPSHVHVVNKPLIFVSANAADAADAMFHCGALVPSASYSISSSSGGGGDELMPGHSLGAPRATATATPTAATATTRPWPSTELRVAVCSKRRVG